MQKVLTVKLHAAEPLPIGCDGFKRGIKELLADKGHYLSYSEGPGTFSGKTDGLEFRFAFSKCTRDETIISKVTIYGDLGTASSFPKAFAV